MSLPALNWALKVLEEPAYAEWKSAVRFVLLIMANRADENGVLYPSVRWITVRTKLAESTVRACTRQIEKAGLLVKEKQARGDGGQTSNFYRLAMNVEALVLAPPPGPLVGSPPATNGGEGMHRLQGPGPLVGPEDTKYLNKQRRKGAVRRTRLPDGFDISERVKRWASGKGFDGALLPAHLEKFLRSVKANGSSYVDWDAALMNCIADDWGDVRKKAGTAAPKPWSEQSCRYCQKRCVGMVNAIAYCDGHIEKAMDREPAPRLKAA